MIHHLALRWLVIGLFVLSAAVFGLVIVTKRRPWTSVVSHALHVVMAVAMVVMAWPWSAQLPTTGPAVFFLLAAVWFVTLAVVEARTTPLRALNGYHALMMLATAWMYAIMNGHLLPVRSSSQQPDMSMPGMDMPGMDMAPMNTPISSGSPLWFSAVNWIGTVGFAVAAVFWTYRYFTERQHEAIRSKSLDNLSQATMAAGMTILFLATLFWV